MWKFINSHSFSKICLSRLFAMVINEIPYNIPEEIAEVIAKILKKSKFSLKKVLFPGIANIVGVKPTSNKTSGRDAKTYNFILPSIFE